MKKSSIYHISEHNFAYAVSDNQLNIRIRTSKGDIDKIVLYYKNLYDHTDFYFNKEMDIILSDEINSLFESTIKVEERHFKYYFELYYGSEKICYTADGFLDSVHEHNCFYFPKINSDEIIKLPQWAQGASVYQILIDRFFDGDSSNNPQNTKDWNALPDNNTYYGGDFQGVIDKIDYIKSLGTDILYLSPIFISPTYHKYDTKDYYAIEEIYGGTEGMKKLVEVAHANGIKIMLDGVFNHCSDEHEFFLDVVKHGENSKYKDWFKIESFPVDTKTGNYDNFGGLVPSMPCFDTTNPEVIKYCCDIALYWTKELGIDGWRLDVGDEVSHTFWQEFRRQLKAYDKDILIVGEVWNHASKWLQGNEFDMVTNYKFRKWMLDFANSEVDATTFWDKMSANSMLYKTQLNNYLINLLGSHDTLRYATHLNDKEASLLAMVSTLAMPGMPLIYYGDEYAQQGDEDPDNRRAMQWDQIKNNAFFDTVKQVAQFRAKSQTLKKGDLQPLLLGERVLAFKREHENKQVVFIANFGDDEVVYEKRNIKKILGQGQLSDDGITLGQKEFVFLGINDER